MTPIRSIEDAKAFCANLDHDALVKIRAEAVAADPRLNVHGRGFLGSLDPKKSAYLACLIYDHVDGTTPEGARREP